MRRSEVNAAVRAAQAFFAQHSWALPPAPRWDVTDFGLGDFPRYGLLCVNLAEEPEYCEKLMYARRGQETPAHTHHKKKEDISVRVGELAIQLWPGRPGTDGTVTVPINHVPRTVPAGTILTLTAGERVTLVPGVYHAFWPTSDEAILGEVSTANDDTNDNIWGDDRVGRFSAIDEDEPALVRLVSD